MALASLGSDLGWRRERASRVEVLNADERGYGPGAPTSKAMLKPELSAVTSPTMQLNGLVPHQIAGMALAPFYFEDLCAIRTSSWATCVQHPLGSTFRMDAFRSCSKALRLAPTRSRIR